MVITLTAGFTFSQHHRDENEDNRNSPTISDRTEELLDKIIGKLDELDSHFLTQLNHREYNKATRELHKIYDLIDAIKKQQYVDEKPPITVMNEGDYRTLVSAINNEAFEENKINVLQASVKYNYFSVEQVIGLIDLSPFSSWKLKALELTYPFIVDKNNSYKILNSFNFSDDKNKAQEILDRN